MNREIVFVRIVRNVLIGVVSAVWIFPFFSAASAVLLFLDAQNLELSSKVEGLKCYFPYMRIARSFLAIGTFWGMIIIAFWAFVAANKLLPIKGKEEK